MSYPFAGTARAQSSSRGPRSPPSHHHHDSDPYSRAPHQYAPYSSQPGYDDYDEDDNVGPAPYRDHPDHRAPINPGDPRDEYDYPAREELNASSADSAYGRGNRNMTSEKTFQDPYAGGGAAARGNSIWTREDKRAFAQRSAPAKICRVLFCVLIIAAIFIISIVCLIVMFARPPNVAISGVGIASNQVSYSNGAFSFNVTVDISISNPNSISATVEKLTAKAYNANDRSTTVGSGEIRDQKIVPHANSTIKFPFSIEYDSSKDPDLSIITDIANKCGLTLSGLTSSNNGGGRGNLDFDFDIGVHISVLSITVPVSFSQDISFPCPLPSEAVQGALGSILQKGLGGRSLPEDDETRKRLLERSWERSPVELVAAAANELVRRSAIAGGVASHPQL